MAKYKALFSAVLQLWLIVLSKGWLFSNNDNCYRRPNVGCFPTSRLGLAPLSPNEIDVNFIYKGNNDEIRFPLGRTRRTMTPHYNPSAKSVFIIHGYMETPTRGWVQSLANQLKTQGPINIFVVDWSAGAFHLNYFQCVANTRMAGAVTALFLQEFLNMGGSASSFHVIGFSLGAHVAGYVGERVQDLGRITGLDPAGPGFIGTERAERLDSTDALVVDTVHTDTDLGTSMRLGTIDFYPNGGANQPQCGSGYMDRLSSLISRMNFSRNSLTRTVGCSHIRATELFTASINNGCAFSMKRCGSLTAMRNNVGASCSSGDCPIFGYHMNVSQTTRSGIYRFSTTGTFPYC